MINPPIQELMTHVDCRYTLVVITAMRARQLVAGSEKLLSTYDTKPVNIAAMEIDQGLIDYVRTYTGEDE